MKCNKKVILTGFIFILMSCVTTGNKLPLWVEIKPVNTTKEIYFVYGPAENRDRAKEGLYKEISEYFGVEVSSVDKYIKQVSVENGVRDINQTKESQIDVRSREKGLSSIEIREIWSDSRDNRWCILASLSREAEAKIKTEVEVEVEADRVRGVLSLAEEYNRNIEVKYNDISDKLNELNKLYLRINQSTNKISEMENSNEIMKESTNGIHIGEKIKIIIKDIKSLTNEIKLNQTKAVLLKNQLLNNSTALIELDLLVSESMDILTYTEDKKSEILEIEKVVLSSLDELNSYYLKSELDKLGKDESNKSQLNIELDRIKSSSKKIIIMKGDIEILFKQSEDIIRELKQISYDDSVNTTYKKKKIEELLLLLEDIYIEARDGVDDAYQLKNNILIDKESVIKSKFILEEDIVEVNETVSLINSPLSWIEIYKDKIAVNLNSGRRISKE